MIRKLPLNFAIFLLVAFELARVSIDILLHVCVLSSHQPDMDAQVLVVLAHAALAEDFFTPSKCVSTIVR